MTRLLVVEDEPLLARSLKQGLEEEGYAVDVCHDGEEALWAARGGEYDAIILDLMIPRRSGMEVCRSLRARGDRTPILMLTARDSPADVVGGLDAGADDYLAKPFAFEVLLARLRTLLRREARATASIVAVGDLSIDLAARRATRGGRTLTLKAKEYQLLEYLALHRGRVVSKDRLLSALWERDGDPDSNVVEVYVARLRRALGKADAPPLIHTVRGMGYMLDDEAPPCA